jgi:hypothetical protein
MPNVQHKRGTRAALVALAGSAGLLPGQVYILTDESRIAVALTASTFETFAKESEAGGGGGSPGGATRELQFNNAGAFDGAANVEVDTSGHLDLSAVTEKPTAPAADRLQLYARKRAGNLRFEVQEPSGINLTMSPHMGYNFTASWLPSDATTVTATGIIRSGVGTVSHPAITAGSRVLSTRRYRMTSAVTANSAAENFANRHHALRGSAAGEGGFDLVMRFSNITLQPASKAFFGLTTAITGLATTLDPATLTNAVGFGFDRAVDANWQLYRNDAAGAAVKVDLGASFRFSAASGS